MKAVILECPGEPLVLSEVELLALGGQDVRIATGASGVCHSDLAYAQGHQALVTPIVLGHEGAGRVIGVGANVTSVSVGDRVVTSWVSYCGRCYQCVNGRGHLCEYQAEISLAPRVARGEELLPAMTGLGTMAEVMTVDESKVVRLQTDLPDEQLALIGCAVATGVGAALWTAKVRPGTSVAVFGCGGVGQAVIQGAAIAGAGQVIAVDPGPLKRSKALRHGATETIDPAVADAVDQIKALTGGRGAEYTFEAAGLTRTIAQSFAAACPGGTVTLVGMAPAGEDLPIPSNLLRREGKRVLGSNYGSVQIRRDMPRLVRLAELGQLDIAGMITKRFSLSDANEAVSAIESGEVIRSVLLPAG